MHKITRDKSSIQIYGYDVMSTRMNGLRIILAKALRGSFCSIILFGAVELRAEIEAELNVV